MPERAEKRRLVVKSPPPVAAPAVPAAAIDQRVIPPTFSASATRSTGLVFWHFEHHAMTSVPWSIIAPRVRAHVGNSPLVFGMPICERKQNVGGLGSYLPSTSIAACPRTQVCSATSWSVLS